MVFFMDLLLLAVQQIKQQGICPAAEFLLKVFCVLAVAYSIDILSQNTLYQGISIFLLTSLLIRKFLTWSKYK